MQGNGSSAATRGSRRVRLRGAVGLAISVALVACIGAGSASAACPNEAFRVGPSALLPECRAYEMVSPVDKNGGSVSMPVEPKTLGSGDAVSFWSSSDFAGAPSRVGANAYVARRGTESWSTEHVVPPIFNPGTILVKSVVPSPDLAKTLQMSNVALTPGAIEGGSNLYLLDNATGERELVVAQEGLALFNNFAGVQPASGYSDGTPDWSHFTFYSSAGLLGAPEEQILYEYANGELRIASRLEGETPVAAHIDASNLGFPYPNSVSSDGSRIFWVRGASTGDGEIYMREDGAETVPISASQKTGEVGTLKEAKFGAASNDGSLVFFTSEENLTDESTNSSNNETLYRYDVESGELTDLLAGLAPDGPGVERLMATSEEGDYVYFAAEGALTPDSTQAPFFGSNLYVWHAGQVDLIGQVAEEGGGPEEAISSPGGEHFAFATREPLGADDPPSAACASAGELCLDVYYYRPATEQLACLSCTGSPAAGDSHLGAQDFHEANLGDEWSRPVLDGGTVFFDTPNRLLLQDVNGVGDPYAWREGALTLLSTGAGAGASNFGAATPDGSTVFIRTADPLVPQDADGSIDLYAVRVGGGLAGQFPPPQPPPCVGEACRGPAPAATPRATPESAGAGRDGDFSGRCLALERRARATDRKADALARRARGASGKRATALRRRAKQQRRKANRLTTNARNCGGQG